MAGRYVPPHLRNNNKTTTTQVHDETEAATANDVKIGRRRKPEDGYSLEEICFQFGLDSVLRIGTLNPATSHDDGGGGGGDVGDATLSIEGGGRGRSDEGNEKGRGQLGFVLLFKDQHPDWPPKIFCKSNLHLLPPAPSPSPLASALLSTSQQVSVSLENGMGVKNCGEGVGHEVSDITREEEEEAAEMIQKDPSITKTTRSTSGSQIQEPSSITSTSTTAKSNNTTTTTRPEPKTIIPIFTQTKPPPNAPATTTSSRSPTDPSTPPISCSIGSNNRDAQRFYFAGNHTIKSIQRLAPRSPELIRMFERKWIKDSDQKSQTQGEDRAWDQWQRQRQRRPEDWNQGLGMEWAVVEFEKVVDREADGGGKGEGDKNPMEPLKLVKEERKQKSVRELLEKLRAGDG